MSVGGFNQDAVAQSYLRAQAALRQGPAPAAMLPQAAAFQSPAYVGNAQAAPVAWAQAPASGLGDALGRLYQYLRGQVQKPAAISPPSNPHQALIPIQPEQGLAQSPFIPVPPPPPPPAPMAIPPAPSAPILPQAWDALGLQGWPQAAAPPSWEALGPQGWPQMAAPPPQPQQAISPASSALPGGWRLPEHWPQQAGQRQAGPRNGQLAPQAGVQGISSQASSAVEMGSVVVQKGDSLMKIAARVYGDEAAWVRLYEANRDQISKPNLIHAGMRLRVPGAQGDRPASDAPRSGMKAQSVHPAPAAPPSGLGARAVAEARRLMAQGYKYPPNLTTKYFHRRFQIGCCADFVVDAWAKAGIDVFKRISNPHYTPSQRQWLKEQGAWAPKGAAVKVGDWVFFKWPGTDASVSHVAMVSEVNAQGQPTRIIESYSGNKPVRERAVASSSKYIVGFGRLDLIAAKA